MSSSPTFYDAGSFQLRAYRLEDAEELCAATNESYELMKPWMEWATNTQSIDMAEVLCQRFMNEYEADRDYVIGAFLENQLIGGTGFHLRSGPVVWRSAEIGMWIRASRAGQGWGTRVLAAMLDWGFGEWGWERLEWRCDTANVASSRVAIKNGLTLEGTIRKNSINVDGVRTDTHVFGILKPEWIRT